MTGKARRWVRVALAVVLAVVGVSGWVVRCLGL